MFQRLQDSWELVKQSMAVLRADKELVVFPIMAAIASMLVFMTFLIPMALTGAGEAMLAEEGTNIVGLIVMFLFYVASYFVALFANSALVGAALIRLRGGDPTVADGLRIAREHIVQILGYAVIAATVGIVLRMISERSGALGRVVVGIIGMAWSLATFLVVPILVVEDVGPIEAVQRSGALLKKTWGEQVAGNFSIGLVFGLAMFVAFLLFIPLFFIAGSMESVGLFIGLIILAVLVMLCLGLLSSTLSGIYAAAVYQYVTTGDSGDFFDVKMIKSSFRPK
ncbi:MAG: DUF6159 family protein [Candidatus Promineifilaceae bacterium]